MALDIIFLSFDEPNADLNFNALKARFPYAKRVHGVVGIANAHSQAAKLADTSLFYVVDGDTEVFETFDFSFKPEKYDQGYVHIWKSRNPVNMLEYGYGGVKLFSKKFFKNLNNAGVDFTTSLTQDVKYIDDVVSYTRFNSDEFRAWRGAFRECAKLSSRSIEGQVDSESEERLNTWCTVYDDLSFFWQNVLKGAQAGKDYGVMHANDHAALAKINDFLWLRSKFEESYNEQ